MPGTSNSGGRNKLSAATHVLRGTFRKERHADDATPAPPAGVPTPPMILRGHAKSEWSRMIDSLQRNGTLSIVDHHALHQYCCLFEETEDLRADYARLRKVSRDMVDAMKKLEGQQLVEALRGITDLEHQIGRLTVKLRQNHLAIRTYLVEFGMTPSARTRVKTTGGGAVTPQSRLDQFRRQKSGA